MTGYTIPLGRITWTLSDAAFACGFTFLRHWARVRRIVAGRHGGPRVFYYTNMDAVEQDFGPVAGRGASVAYRQAVAAFDVIEYGTRVHDAISGLLDNHPNVTAETKLSPWAGATPDEILADLKLIGDATIESMRAEDERSAAYWASIGAGPTCEMCGAEPGYPCPVPTGHPCGRDKQ